MFIYFINILTVFIVKWKLKKMIRTKEPLVTLILSQWDLAHINELLNFSIFNYERDLLQTNHKLTVFLVD